MKHIMILLLGVGCAQAPALCEGNGNPCPEHLNSTIVVLPDVDPDIVDAVYSATEEWRSIDERIQIQIIMGTDSSGPHVTTSSDLHDDAHLAEYVPQSEALVFRPMTRYSDARAYALHELGHFLGLDHSFVIGDAMHPVVPVRHLSDADIASFKSLYP